MANFLVMSLIQIKKIHCMKNISLDGEFVNILMNTSSIFQEKLI